MPQILVVPLAFTVCLFILLGWHFERPPGQQAGTRRSEARTGARSAAAPSQQRES